MTGVLVVDKPAGPTSHDVVARVRRAIGERRVGHTGTLDPLATGVLPLVVGSATRLASLLSSGEKEYVAGVRLGTSTDTYDGAGAPLERPASRDAASVTREELEAALAEYRGTYDQMPPAFSAKKVGGVAAYKLARRKQPVALARAPVTVSALTLDAFDDGLATLRLACSAGFYVRTLAHELGERLGCGAHLSTLRRTRAAGFGERDAVPLEVVEGEGPRAGDRLVTGDRLLPGLPAVVLTDRGVRRASHGNRLGPEDWTGGPPPGAESGAGGRHLYRLLDARGRLLGIAQPEADGSLHPSIVLG